MKIQADVVYSSGRLAAGDSVEGAIRIIESEDDLSKIEQGDVAVAVALDADVPQVVDEIIFKSLAAALITRTGGYAAHFAQIAREMSMPGMTIEAAGGEAFFRDGQRVQVTLLRQAGHLSAEIEAVD